MFRLKSFEIGRFDGESPPTWLVIDNFFNMPSSKDESASRSKKLQPFLVLEVKRLI